MDHVPNRFDRIIAILIQLQSRKVVKAKDLADRFGVTLRTIYRDIKTLDQAGVPVLGEAGTGYSIMDGYRLPPVMFTREEAGSFVAAEKLMEKFTDEMTNTHFARAMYKIKSVLRSDEKNLVALLESQIDIKASLHGFNKNLPHALHHVITSMTNQNQIGLFYQSPKNDTPVWRNVEVIGVFHENQFWYLYAYCHLRQNYRQFRIDRIIDLKLIQTAFTKKHPALQELRDKNKTVETTRVCIRVKKSVAPYLRFGREYHGFVAEKKVDDGIEMVFDSPCVEMDFARWYVTFADYAEIIEPNSLRHSVKSILEKAIRLLD